MFNRSDYLIDFSRRLGYGATAQVFLGINESSGAQCAMKCIINIQTMKDEVSIMRDLDHENIIKFYASLPNFERYAMVIAMEYCNAGSLHEFIRVHGGLCDNMFLMVLECLHRGIQYLRGKHLVHRDIKPGNMLVTRDPCGHYRVKLGDLGAAKRVEDHETYGTLVGTPAYLHPDLYSRHAGHSEAPSDFKASTDLWAIGVTLFHAAADELPFSASDQAALSEMHRRRPPGFISGKQHGPRDEDVVWSKELPTRCRLSPMLQALAAALIANLMDATDSYDPFFSEAIRVLQKRRVLMFSSVSGELQVLYLENLSPRSVVDQACESAGVAKEDAVVLTRCGRLLCHGGQEGRCLPSLPVAGRLRYALGDDTVLVATSKAVVAPLAARGTSAAATAASLDAPRPSYTSPKDDARYAEELMRAVHMASDSANYADCQLACFQATAAAYTEHVLEASLVLMRRALCPQMRVIRDSCSLTLSLVAVAEKALVLGANTGDAVQQSLARCRAEVGQLRHKADEGEACVLQFHSKIVAERGVSASLPLVLATEPEPEDAALAGDALDLLVRGAEGLLTELRLVPLEHIVGQDGVDDDAYKVEVWRRHLQLFALHRTATQGAAQRVQRVRALHAAFLLWFKQPQSIAGRIQSLRTFLQSQEERRLSLRSKFLQIEDFLIQILEDADTRVSTPYVLQIEVGDSVKARILELRQLSRLLVERYCGAPPGT